MIGGTDEIPQEDLNLREVERTSYRGCRVPVCAQSIALQAVCKQVATFADDNPEAVLSGAHSEHGLIAKRTPSWPNRVPAERKSNAPKPCSIEPVATPSAPFSHGTRRSGSNELFAATSAFQSSCSFALRRGLDSAPALF